MHVNDFKNKKTAASDQQMSGSSDSDPVSRPSEPTPSVATEGL